MQSFILTALIASSTLLSSAFAQVYPPVNVTDIDLAIRNSWCVSQVSSCKLLCQNQELKVSANECFPDNLYFQCLCSDGVAPNVTEYSQTIPYFMCTLEVSGCERNCDGNSECQSLCTSSKHCGASNPTRVNATSTATTTTASNTATNSITYDENGFAVTGTAAPTETGNSGAARLIEVGSVYGLGVMIAGMAAGVAMVGL